MVPGSPLRFGRDDKLSWLHQLRRPKVIALYSVSRPGTSFSVATTWSKKDPRVGPEDDGVGRLGILDVNVGLRLGQGGSISRRVPITLSDLPPHPERCSDALHETHEQHQHRIDPTIERRRGNHSV